MFAKLENLEKRYEELEQALADPAVLSDPEQYRKTAKARADVEPVVLAFREYRDLQKQLEENKELLSDEDHDIRDMAQEEIRRIDASVKLNHRMLDWLPSVLVPGQDEASVAWAIEKFYRENGASELSFPSIVAMNANAALPHYAPEQPAEFTENCMVLVDEGCRLNQYCSDQTRTCWIGDRPEPRFTEMLERVQEAQRRAIAALRPGVTGREVHQIAVDYFASCGMERYFTHSLGHGVGLETHEGPRLSISNTRPLQPGMIVTIEPGLYFPGWGGARWEYMAVITEDGCRVF